MIPALQVFLRFLIRYWRRLLVGFIVLTVILGAIARVLAPQVPEVAQPNFPISEPLAGPVEVVFTGDQQLPNSLALFAGADFLPPNQVGEFVARQLGLTLHPQVSGLYGNEDLSVTLAQPDGLFVADYSNANAAAATHVTLERAQELAEAFLQQAGYPVNQLALIEKETRYIIIQGEEHYTETSPASAQAIELAYVRQIGGYPASLSSTPTNTLRLVVSNDGVLNASLISLWFTTESRGEAPLLSLPDILDELRAGQYLILGTIDIIDPRDPENTLVTLELSRKQVEYRFDSSQELFIPFVQFSGTATLRSGSELPIVITTPALQTVPALQ